jgi:WD40 repeat protein
VYGGAFYPDTSAEADTRLIVTTVCYDQRVRIWLMNLNFDGKCLSEDCVAEMNIMSKPEGGARYTSAKGIYDDDILDDAALQMIVNPNNKNGTQSYMRIAQTCFDYVHPNCLCYNANGRLFVGDSRGIISVWDVNIRQGNLYTDNFFQIRQKELEGDEINQLIVHPEHENKLFVHSRDNCIRLLEYESMKGPRIRKRFFGAKCKDLMVRSTVSPDG